MGHLNRKLGRRIRTQITARRHVMRLNHVMLLLTLLIVFVISPLAQLWSQSAVPTAPASPATLPAGTIIRLRTTQAVDSKHAKAGDTLPRESNA